MSAAYLEELKGHEDKKEESKLVPDEDSVIVAEPEQDLNSMVSALKTPECLTTGIQELVQKRTGDTAQPTDTEDVPIGFREKKRLHWAGKTCGWIAFLASLVST